MLSDSIPNPAAVRSGFKTIKALPRKRLSQKAASSKIIMMLALAAVDFVVFWLIGTFLLGSTWMASLWERTA